MSDERHQRAIDRILADDYLDGLGEHTTAELRRMRDECEQEESGLSYARRVVQGRLDILRAEALRRQDRGADTSDLLGRLPTILRDDARPTDPSRTRATRHLVPPHVHHHGREVDNIADEESMADLSERSIDDLRALVDRFGDVERELSRVRRTVLDRIDAIQDELIARYKAGTADVSEVLAEQP